VRVTRDLGLFDVTMAALGAMVGAAIFLLVGATYTVAGPLVLVSLGVATFVALLAGMSYAELASGRPDASGGAYVWVRSALPSPAGFLSGWLSWGAHMAATALGALGLGLFFIELVRPSGFEAFFKPNPVEVGLVALAVLALSAVLHFARVHLPVRALGRLTLAKVLLIVLLAAVGLVSFLPASPAPAPTATAPTSLDLVLGAGVLFIAFQGFEVVAQLGDQAKRPESTVPRAMFLALLLSSLVYAAFLLAILGNATPSALAGWPNCTACRGGSEDMTFISVPNFLGGPYVRVAFLLIGILSMYGALNAHLTSAIKTSFSMARDGLLPAILSRIGGREVPPAAVALTLIGAGVLVFLTVEAIAILASLAFLGLFAFVHASVIALRRRERRSGPGFRVPFVPVLPMFAVALNLALGATLWSFPAMADSPIPPGVLAMSLGGIWLAIGGAYHAVSARRRARPSVPGTAATADVRDILTTSEEGVELERYRVFLPLREFDDTTLVEFGARVARARKAELSLLNVVEIPRNLPPNAIRFRFVDERIRGLRSLARIGEDLGVDTRPVVKIGHKVYEIILDTIREEAVNLVVMGWRGARIEGDRRVLGSNIDYLIENAPCDVVVFKTQGLRRPLRRIVILTSPIWSLDGIDDLALVVAEDDAPVVEVVCLASDPAEAERLKLDSARFEGRARERGVTVEPKVVYSTQWESEALRESAEASLLMIRATSPGGLRKFALSPVEDRIVKLAKCPVIILRARSGPGAG